MCELARRGIMSQATALGARMCQSTFFVLWQEGRRMFFIGGISSGVKPLEYLKTVICGRCGAYGRYQVYMTYMYFSFFFIPIFKWNRRFFVEMSCCGAVYELDPEVGKRLLRGEEVEITERDLTLRQDGNGNPWTGSDASHRHKVCPSCGFETDEDFSYCPKCGKPMTMNLRADDTFVQDKGWYRAAERYEEFLRRHKNLHILFLELGVGYNTPVIIKYSFWQMTAKNSKAVYACVNFGEAFCPKQIQSQAICINIDIHNFLRSNKANIFIAKPWLFLIIIYNFHY